MFKPLLTLYENKFHVILIDFLGHGRSERLEKFPADLWVEESRQTDASIIIFPTWNHLAILSYAEQAADVIRRFLE